MGGGGGGGVSNAHRAPAANVIILSNGIYGLKVGYEQFETFQVNKAYIKVSGGGITSCS